MAAAGYYLNDEQIESLTDELLKLDLDPSKLITEDIKQSRYVNNEDPYNLGAYQKIIKKLLEKASEIEKASKIEKTYFIPTDDEDLAKAISESLAHKKKPKNIPPGFNLIINAGGGECLYLSFIQGHKYLKSIGRAKVPIPETSKDLRNYLIKTLDNLDIQRFFGGEEKTDVIKTRLKNDKWGQDEEILLLADTFNICIWIWIPSSSRWEKFEPRDISRLDGSVDACRKRVIHIYNTTGLHYEFLQPQETSYSLGSSSRKYLIKYYG
jgi:hypothetical protein